MTRTLTHLHEHPPVSRHANHPQWRTISALARVSFEALAEVRDLTPAEVDWLTRRAADAYFDLMEAERYRALGAVDCGRTVQ